MIRTHSPKGIAGSSWMERERERTLSQLAFPMCVYVAIERGWGDRLWIEGRIEGWVGSPTPPPFATTTKRGVGCAE